MAGHAVQVMNCCGCSRPFQGWSLTGSVDEWFFGLAAFGLRFVWLGLMVVVVKPGDTPAGV